MNSRRKYFKPFKRQLVRELTDPDVERLLQVRIRRISLFDINQHRKEMEQALIEARHDAERANNANTAFLTAASHDLRQPVQALALLNGALRRTVKDELALEMIESQFTKRGVRFWRRPIRIPWRGHCALARSRPSVPI